MSLAHPPGRAQVDFGEAGIYLGGVKTRIHYFCLYMRAIRRRHLVQKQSISAIAREMQISRPTVRKHLQTVEEPKYERRQPPSPKLGGYAEQLEQWLEEESKLARPRRRSGRLLFEGLQEIVLFANLNFYYIKVSHTFARSHYSCVSPNRCYVKRMLTHNN